MRGRRSAGLAPAERAGCRGPEGRVGQTRARGRGEKGARRLGPPGGRAQMQRIGIIFLKEMPEGPGWDWNPPPRASSPKATSALSCRALSGCLPRPPPADPALGGWPQGPMPGWRWVPMCAFHRVLPVSRKGRAPEERPGSWVNRIPGKRSASPGGVASLDFSPAPTVK